MIDEDYKVVELIKHLGYMEAKLLYSFYNSTRTAQKHLTNLVNKGTLKRQVIDRNGRNDGYLYYYYKTRAVKQVSHVSYTAKLIAKLHFDIGEVNNVAYESILYKGDGDGTGIRCDAICTCKLKDNSREVTCIIETQLGGVSTSLKLDKYDNFSKTLAFEHKFGGKEIWLLFVTNQQSVSHPISIQYEYITLKQLEDWSLC